MIRSSGKSCSEKECVFLKKINALFGRKNKVANSDFKDKDRNIPFSNVTVDVQALGSGISKVNERILPPSSLKLKKTESHNGLKLCWKSGFLHRSYLIQMNTSNPEVEASWMTCGISNQNEFDVQLYDTSKNLWFRVSTIQGNERSQWSVELMYSLGKIGH
jgi:hypothetical protein